jgi:hypothetical protein
MMFHSDIQIEEDAPYRNIPVEQRQTNKATYLMSPLDRELIIIIFGLILLRKTLLYFYAGG